MASHTAPAASMLTTTLKPRGARASEMLRLMQPHQAQQDQHGQTAMPCQMVHSTDEGWSKHLEMLERVWCHPRHFLDATGNPQRRRLPAVCAESCGRVNRITRQKPDTAMPAVATPRRRAVHPDGVASKWFALCSTSGNSQHCAEAVRQGVSWRRAKARHPALSRKQLASQWRRQEQKTPSTLVLLSSTASDVPGLRAKAAGLWRRSNRRGSVATRG
eukprot:NODE_15851_length_1027_cov_3.066667.p2 GENE.NODE_15851_length_1027_cov_3.066667~~NODE_15851_length_1027_cov_3.066667.p2  ORF type:complete len:217 (-),score=13.89 NODE_15851_length_1027_cov_3.066667:247-897(-)